MGWVDWFGLGEAPELSQTELTRVQGLMALGVLGAVFLPDCVSFGLGGQAWWGRVGAQHSAQVCNVDVEPV